MKKGFSQWRSCINLVYQEDLFNRAAPYSRPGCTLHNPHYSIDNALIPWPPASIWRNFYQFLDCLHSLIDLSAGMSYLIEGIVEGTWCAQDCHLLFVFSALLAYKKSSFCLFFATWQGSYLCERDLWLPSLSLIQRCYIRKPTWPHVESHTVRLALFGNKDDFQNLHLYRSYKYLSPASKPWRRREELQTGP